jgi:hypothetical protein
MERANVKVLLRHTCRAKEFAGQPGNVVTVPAHVAEAWFKNGGASPVDEPEAVPAAKKEPPAKPGK